MLNWKTRADNVVCAEPYGLRYWYYIDENILQLVDAYGYVGESYIGNVTELQLIAQQHYEDILAQLK